MSKTDAIIALRKHESEEKKIKVIETINNMVKNKEEITFTTVYKKACVSKGFVYNSPEIRDIIYNHIKNPIRVTRTQDSKDVIIDLLRNKIRELEKENKALKESESYKDKYHELLKKNKELTKQLEVAYTYHN